MQAPISISIHKNNFWLSAARCMFWEEEKALILADLHLGKTGHFRKAGIPVPQNILKEDLHRLFTQVQYFNPKKIIVVGDFFHSTANNELKFFKKWRADFKQLSIYLVPGNHDILHQDWYNQTDIHITDTALIINNFSFCHDNKEIKKIEDKKYFTFSGHVHPSVCIQGVGKQRLQLPCFYFTDNHCILPAFSYFTGTSIIQPKTRDNVFAILPSSISKKETASIIRLQ